MTGTGNAITKRVREWLRHADEDLRLARHAFRLKSAVPYRLIAYHAQQCAEKSLKAYLVHSKIDFPYTHNISLLLEMLPPHADWRNDLWNAGVLGSYAVTARYPGKEKVTKREALQAVSLADNVQKTIIKALAHEGLKIALRARG